MTQTTDPFKRPRWAIPVAIIGAVLLLIGLTIGVFLGSGDNKPITVTSTTSTSAGPAPPSGGGR